jgi:long-chain acyl-CoA synthetase
MLQTPSEQDIEHLIEEEIREINSLLPLYKKIKSYTIQYEELEKTTTKKIKRYVNKD